MNYLVAVKLEKRVNVFKFKTAARRRAFISYIKKQFKGVEYAIAKTPTKTKGKK